VAAERVQVKAADKRFWQGWALLARFIAIDYDEPSMVLEAADQHGVTLAMLEEAEVDEYDLEALRPIFVQDAAAKSRA
jgi:hypothetical protein